MFIVFISTFLYLLHLGVPISGTKNSGMLHKKTYRMFLHNQLPRARPQAWRGLSRTVTENCNTQRRVTNPDLARSQNCEKWLLTSSCVCPFAWKNSAPKERIFVKFCTWGFFENLSRNFNFHYNVIPRITKIIRSGITFVSRNVISRRFL